MVLYWPNFPNFRSNLSTTTGSMLLVVWNCARKSQPFDEFLGSAWQVLGRGQLPQRSSKDISFKETWEKTRSSSESTGPCCIPRGWGSWKWFRTFWSENFRTQIVMDRYFKHHSESKHKLYYTLNSLRNISSFKTLILATCFKVQSKVPNVKSNWKGSPW